MSAAARNERCEKVYTVNIDYVIDKSEDDRRSRTIYTLEKFEESIESVLYKPEDVEQVLS